MYTATIINYFDVWGNAKDGWEINNLCKDGEIELSEEFTHQEILAKLRDVGFLRKGVGLNRLDVEDLHPYYEITKKTNGFPVCRIELQETN